MENKKFSVAIIGCGNRGVECYGRIMRYLSELYTVAALCDIDPVRLENGKNELCVAPENLYANEEEFFKAKRADVLIVATQDGDHVRHALLGLEKGYDILLEKPLTKSREECLALLEAQKKYGGRVLVCHVLRYAPAFVKAAELLDSGKIGKLVFIDAIEQVGYWHQAHSFVRGNWRRSEQTSPMVLAKTCHDLDYIQFFAGAKCRSLSSVGELTFFKSENAPEGAAERCTECKYIDTCPYSAKKIYLERFLRGEGEWPTSVMTLERPITEDGIWRAMKEGPYGRCVFKCDNDVVDHQVTTMTFENGVKANLIMTGFARGMGRRIAFHGTYGEIVIDEVENFVRYSPYGYESETWKISELISEGKEGHGGGDIGLIRKMYDILSGRADNRTSLEASVESHLMGICAEESRLAGGALMFVHE